jgi:hypothetical protein
MSINWKKNVLLACATALTAGAFAIPASARTTPAILGRALLPSENGCFSEYYGRIYNNGSSGCSGARTYLMPGIEDGAGWVNMTVGGYASGLSSDVSCRAIGISWDGLIWDLYPAKSLTSTNVWQQITVTTWFPGNGSPYMACSLAPNGQVSTMTY